MRESFNYFGDGCGLAISSDRVGTYTGMYSTFTLLAPILGGFFSVAKFSTFLFFASPCTQEICVSILTNKKYKKT